MNQPIRPQRGPLFPRLTALTAVGLVALATVFLYSCMGRPRAASPTATPTRTATPAPYPSATPPPTPTLLPTETPMPSPTFTPIPSDTPTPPPTATATPLPTETPTAAPNPAIPGPPSAQSSPVEALLARMTVEEKVGQLFGIYFTENFYSPALQEMIVDYHVGAILIFRRNVAGLVPLAELINQAQADAVANGAGIPLLVAIDQEGGPVVRLDEGATVFPSNMAVGATGSPEVAAQVAAIMAAEMAALGINMNLAPVLDVNNNPANPVIGTRSFSSSPELVARLGTAAIRAYQDNGILATAKHFPGHGDTEVDSHLALPVISHPRERLQAVELLPFQAAVEAGVAAIMTAHVAFPAADPVDGRPATFSPAVLQDLLRGEMGFPGLIATDSLGMGALSNLYSPSESAVHAFLAGSDLLLYGADPGHSPAEQRPAYTQILHRVQAGEISQERLDASVRRILLAKAQYGILDWQPVDPAAVSQRVGTTAHRAVARQVALDAITLVRDSTGLLPLAPEANVVALLPRWAPALGPALQSFHPQLRTFAVSLDPTAVDIQFLQEQLEGADAVVVATGNVQRHPGQAALVSALAGYPVVAVALHSPYDLLAYPDVPAYLATYSDVPVSLEALAQVLYGQAEPRGRLPVELPGLYTLGHGE